MPYSIVDRFVHSAVDEQKGRFYGSVFHNRFRNNRFCAVI